MKNHLPKELRKQRNAVLRQAFAEMGEAYRRKFLGRKLAVLWEACAQVNDQGWQMEGLSGNYIRVTATAPGPRWNVVDEVELTGVNGDGLVGSIRA